MVRGKKRNRQVVSEPFLSYVALDSRVRSDMSRINARLDDVNRSPPLPCHAATAIANPWLHGLQTDKRPER